MRCYPRLGCPVVDEIAVTASAPELAMVSQLLKASCASYTQRARSTCFVPAMQKMQNNRDFTLSQ